MLAYLARRLLLVIPTLFGIMLANFLIVQAAPGGPVDLMLARLRGHASQATARIGATGTGETATGRAARPGGGDDDLTRGTRGIDPELVRQLEKQFGFDKPAWQRFVHMMRSYLVFDLGTSFYRDRPVLGLMLEKLPVSVTLGLWTTLLVYLISIPLGVAKAVRDGTPFDVWTSAAVIVGYAIPGFLFAILLVVLLAGGSFVQWFPLRGLTSDTWALMSWPQRIGRLPVAHRPARHRARGGRLRGPDHAHQELVPGRDQQAVRGHRAGQGALLAAGALRPRVPQRHAHRGGRFPQRVRGHLLRRRAA